MRVLIPAVDTFRSEVDSGDYLPLPADYNHPIFHLRIRVVLLQDLEVSVELRGRVPGGLEEIFLKERIVEDVGEEEAKLISNDIIFGAGGKLDHSSLSRFNDLHPDVLLDHQVLIPILNRHLRVPEYLLGQQHRQGQPSRVIHCDLLLYPHAL